MFIICLLFKKFNLYQKKNKNNLFFIFYFINYDHSIQNMFKYWPNVFPEN